jgi:hypothetical protein
MLAPIRDSHAKLVLGVWSLVCDVSSGRTESAPGRAATLAALFNGLYLFSLSALAVPRLTQYKIQVLICVGAGALLYIPYVERVIVRNLSQQRQAHSRWRTAAVLYAIGGLVAPVLAGAVSFVRNR